MSGFWWTPEPDHAPHPRLPEAEVRRRFALMQAQVPSAEFKARLDCSPRPAPEERVVRGEITCTVKVSQEEFERLMHGRWLRLVAPDGTELPVCFPSPSRRKDLFP